MRRCGKDEGIGVEGTREDVGARQQTHRTDVSTDRVKKECSAPATSTARCEAQVIVKPFIRRSTTCEDIHARTEDSASQVIAASAIGVNIEVHVEVGEAESAKEPTDVRRSNPRRRCRKGFTETSTGAVTRGDGNLATNVESKVRRCEGIVKRKLGKAREKMEEVPGLCAVQDWSYEVAALVRVGRSRCSRVAIWVSSRHRAHAHFA